MRMPVWVALAEFPALSLHVAVADPEAVSVRGTMGVPGPDTASVQVQVTVTGPLLHPTAAVAGEMLCNWRTGGVLSMRMGPAVAEAELPAWSRQVPPTTVPGVSPISVVSPRSEER